MLEPYFPQGLARWRAAGSVAYREWGSRMEDTLAPRSDAEKSLDAEGWLTGAVLELHCPHHRRSQLLHAVQRRIHQAHLSLRRRPARPADH